LAAEAAAETGVTPGRCYVNLDKAFLPDNMLRPFLLGASVKNDTEGSWNASALHGYHQIDCECALSPGDGEPSMLSAKEDVGIEGPLGSVSTVVPLSMERHRLIPSYRVGDRKIEAGQDLFSIGSTGSAVFNLLDGWVALYTLLEDGRRQIVQFALPGAVLGVLPSARAQTTIGALALTDIVVSVVPVAKLTSLSRAEPEISMRLARSLAYDCSLAFDRMTSIGRRSARERVAHLLLELFTRYRAQWPGNRIEEMMLPITQEHIGDATGLTFVHVNRVLSTFLKERIVHFHYRRLRILDPDRLIEVAGVDPEMAAAWLER
jgi:CRP/FNR family transcriptional regulator